MISSSSVLPLCHDRLFMNTSNHTNLPAMCSITYALCDFNPQCPLLSRLLRLVLLLTMPKVASLQCRPLRKPVNLRYLYHFFSRSTSSMLILVLRAALLFHHMQSAPIPAKDPTSPLPPVQALVYFADSQHQLIRSSPLQQRTHLIFLSLLYL